MASAPETFGLANFWTSQLEEHRTATPIRQRSAKPVDPKAASTHTGRDLSSLAQDKAFSYIRTPERAQNHAFCAPTSQTAASILKLPSRQ